MHLSEIIRSIAEPVTQKGYDLFGGNCLDFAAGVALALQDNGYDAWIASIERLDLDDYDEEEIDDICFDDVETILSHAVVGVFDNGRITYYDALGGSADRSWEVSFNSIRLENNEHRVEFDIVDHKGDVMNVYEEINSNFNMNRQDAELIEFSRGILNNALKKNAEPEHYDSPGL